MWRGGLGREQSRRKGGEAPFTKCKSRGGKPPTVSAQSLIACGVAWGRHGRARGRSPPRRPASTPASTATRGPLGRARPRPAARASSRAGIAPARGRARRQSAFPWRARVLARPPPPRSSADGRPSRPSTPAPVRADRVRHATGAARRTGRSSPTARAARAREPADAAADAHAAGGPAAALQSCINLQSRVACPHNPSTCLASHLYPTPVADKPQANDPKDGERARAPSNRRPVPRARRRASVSH